MTELRSSGARVDVPPGTRVGHYTIIETLGEGGEAVVYRARDQVLDRDVALKTPRCALASPKEHAHLLKEARAASRLSHPNIVPVHEVFEDQGKPWVAMALVEGTTIRAAIGQRGALPVEEVVRYGEMLADALHAAHAKQVLHRDVTPANIFITPDGRLLLSDFGLARLPCAPAAGPPDAPTVSASREHVAGTLGYMSPEQMLGREAGPQSDIFSAGAVLYQMATGSRPFRGTTFGEVLDSTLHTAPPPIAAREEGQSDLDHIIRKALAKRPDERYASAADMVIDLRALRRRLESVDHEVPPKPVSRWRLRWLAGAAGVVGAVAVGAWGWTTLRPPGLPLDTAHSRLTWAPGWEAEPRIASAGLDIAYAAEGADGNVDIYQVSPGSSPVRITDDPAVDRCPAWFPDESALAFVSHRNGRADVWKVGRGGGQSPTLLVPDADQPAISPDGSQIAFTRAGSSGHRRVFVASLSVPGGARSVTNDGDGLWDHESPTWSPDGRSLCYSGFTNLWVIQLTSQGAKARRLTTDDESDFEPAWGTDGWVYFSSLRGGTAAIWRVQPAGGGRPQRVTPGSGPERQPSLSRDGRRLVYSTLSVNSNIVVRPLGNPSEAFEFGDESAELSPALKPDGSAIAYSSDRLKAPADIWVQPLDPTGRPEGSPSRLTDQPGSASHPTYSPDGRWIAYYRVLQGARDLYTIPSAGGSPVQFTNHEAADLHPDWSPGIGRWIAFASERKDGWRLWIAPVSEGREAGPPWQATTEPVSVMSPSWSADSARVAFVGTDPQGSREVWTVGITSTGAKLPAHRVTTGAEAHRVAWGVNPNALLVSGSWGLGQLELRSVDLPTGATSSLGGNAPFGYMEGVAEFSVTRDGRLLALVHHAARGDIRMIEAIGGRY